MARRSARARRGEVARAGNRLIEQLEPRLLLANNSLVTARDLEPSAVALQEAGARLSVVDEVQVDSLDDYYSFSLAAGQLASLWLTTLNGGDLELSLLDSSGAVLARGVNDEFRSDDALIAGFRAPVSGTYYALVEAEAGDVYSLVVTRGAAIENPFRARDAVQDISQGGQALGTFDPSSLNGPDDSHATNLPVALFDDDFGWDVQQDGSIGNGSNDAFDGGIKLPNFTASAFGRLENDFQQVVLGPMTSGSVSLTRRVFVPDDGQPSLARFLDSVTNTSASPVNYLLELESNLGSDNRTSIIATSSGDVTLTAADNWVVTDDGPGGDPAIAHLFAGPGGQRPAAVSLEGDTLRWSYNLSLAPGQTKTVMQLASQATDAAGAQANAVELATLSAYVLDGMSFAARSRVVNFVVPRAMEFYTFSAAAGDHVVITTSTLPDGSELDPILELFGPDGAILGADDNGLDDGRNARITFDVVSGGVYRVGFGSGTVAGGSYTVAVTGATAGPLAPMTASTPSILSGVTLEALPATIDIAFSRPILATSVQAGDLRINDVPANAVSILSGDTIRFTTTGVAGGEGPYVLSIPAGAVRDLSGTGNAPFSVSLDIKGPDLVVQNATAPAAGTVGQTISISYTVANQGSAAAAGPWFDQIYISNDAVLDSTDSPVAFHDPAAFLPLAAGGSYSVTRNIVLGAHLAPGDRFLIFTADGGNSRAEANEGNNRFAVPITLGAPDLVIESATASPLSGAIGQTLNISWTVRNQGTVPLVQTSWFDAVFMSADNVLDSTDSRTYFKQITGKSPLGAGASYSMNETLTLNGANVPTSGFLIFQVDAFRGVGESDDGNNTFVVPFTFSAPDLVVSSITPVGTVGLGQRASVTWTVANPGGVAATAGWFDAVYLSDDELFDTKDTALVFADVRSNAPLASGGSYTVSRDVQIPSTAAVGGRFLLVVANSNSAQGESDRTNNVRATPIALVAPNLAVTNAAAPAVIAYDQDFSIAWTVVNQGTVELSRSWQDAVYLSSDAVLQDSDWNLDSQFVDNSAAPLPAGGSYARTSRTLNVGEFSIPPGKRYLLIVTDAFREQGETVETDNMLVVPIEFRFPDLMVTTASATPVGSDGSFTVNWTVDNPGVLDTASPGWWDVVALSADPYFDGNDRTLDQVFFSNNPKLAAGGSYSSSSTLTVGPEYEGGDRYVLVVANAFRSQHEEEMVNNVFAMPFHLDRPDLTPTNVTAPSRVVANGDFVVSWTVSNAGTAPTSSTFWNDSVYISDDPNLDRQKDILVGNIARDSSAAHLGVGDTYTAEGTFTVPNTGSGDRYLLVVVDDSASQGEIKEQNNIRATAIHLDAPDLEVSDVTSPAAALVGEAVAVSYTVLNNSDFAAAYPQWHDSVLLSKDAVVGNDDLEIGGFFRPDPAALDAHTSYTINGNLTIPASRPPGAYFLLFFADRFDLQGETDNANNYQAVPITLSAPDLAVTTARAPETALPGQTISIDWTVSNPSTLDALASSWNDLIYLSTDTTLDRGDRFVGSANHSDGLGAGRSYSQSLDISLPGNFAGSLFLLFASDPLTSLFTSNSQGETDESNNTFAVPIELTATDLVMSSATAPAAAALSEPIEISYTVRNTGTNAAAGQWQDAIYVSNDAQLDASDTLVTIIDTSSFRPLAAGGSYTVTQTIAIPNTATGARFLLFVSDPGKAQAETNETNNQAAAPITLSAPDLTGSIDAVPSAAGIGETISVTWTVSNASDVIAWADSRDALYLSTDEVLSGDDLFLGSFGSEDVAPVPAGGAHTATQQVLIPAFVAGGTHHLLLQIDDLNRQGETDETNNLASALISIGVPDLQLSNITTPATIVQGQSAGVGWTVTNLGSTPAVADWVDRVYLSTDAVLSDNDLLLLEQDVAAETPLGPSASYSINATFPAPNMPGGSYFLIIIANASESQSETSRANNAVARPVEVESRDLVVSSVLAPVEAFSGKAFTVTWTLTNTGALPVIGTWRDAVYFAPGTTLPGAVELGAFEITAAILPGESLTRTQSVAPPLEMSGDGTILVQADQLNNVIEGDEQNNVGAPGDRTLIQLSPVPNLVVSSVTAPATAFAGQQTEIDWVVTNTGTGSTSATSWTDAVYLSLDQQLDSTDILLGRANNASYLNPGESYSNSLVFKLPFTAESNHFFIVRTDFGNQVREVLHEDDNTRISDAPTFIALPEPADLVVSSVAAPASAFSGQLTSFTWTVTNSGTGRTLQDSWFDAVYMSADDRLDEADALLGTYLHDIDYQLFRREVHTYEAFGTTAPADTDVETSAGMIEDKGVADAVVLYNTRHDSLLHTGNGGSGTIRERIDVTYRVVPAGGALDVGQSYSETRQFRLPVGISGDFFFLVRTDEFRQVFEHALDDNNTNFDPEPSRVNLTPPPDLEVGRVSVPAGAFAGRTLHIEYELANNGATETPNSAWNQAYYLSADAVLDTQADRLLATRRFFGPMSPGQSLDLSADIPLPLDVNGAFFVLVVADSSSEVFELDRANNIAASPAAIAIVPDAPDLVSTVLASPENGESGAPIHVSFSVVNQGHGPTYNVRWTDRVVISGDDILGNSDDVRLIAMDRGGVMEAGEGYDYSSLSLQIPPNLPTGQYHLFAVADADNTLFEGASEDNNAPSVPISIIRKTPDLIVSEVTAPASGVSGTDLTVSWRVQNAGSGRSFAGYWHDAAYLSLDGELDSTDIALGSRQHSGDLAAGESYGSTGSFTIPIDLAGDFFIIVSANSSQRVDEAGDESNNSASAPGVTRISLAPVSDLRVASVEAPLETFSGQPFTLNWTLANDGGAPTATYWFDAVYLSPDQLFDPQTDTFIGSFRQTASLVAGGTLDTTAGFSVPAGLSGPLYVFVVTDSNDRIHERERESNNASHDPISMLVHLSPPADLVVGAIELPELDTGTNARITYTINNAGLNTARGTWFDSVYISADEAWDLNDAFFGRVQHTGDVTGGGSYSGSLAAPLPGVLPGTYHVIVRTDIRNHVPEDSEDNNLRATLDSFTYDVPTLTPGGLAEGSLTQGQSAYYRVTVPQGITLQLALDSDSTEAFNQVFVKFGAVPTRSDYDFGSDSGVDPDQVVLIPFTREGTYYVQIFGNRVPATAFYTLAATEVPFEIRGVSTSTVGNTGEATLQIKGARFDRYTRVEIVGRGQVITPRWLYRSDSTAINATFDFTGRPVGDYDLRVYRQDDFANSNPVTGELGISTQLLDEAVLANAIHVVAGGEDRPSARLRLPSAARFGDAFVFYVEIANNGNTDIPAPVYLVHSPTGVPVSFSPNRGAGTGTQQQIVAVGQYRPTVLSPGERITVPMYSRAAFRSTSRFVLRQVDDTGPIDWDSLESYYRGNRPEAEWQQTWSRFKSIVGGTYETLRQAMRYSAADLNLDGAQHHAGGAQVMRDLLLRAAGGQVSPTDFLSAIDRTPGPGRTPIVPIPPPSPSAPGFSMVEPGRLSAEPAPSGNFCDYIASPAELGAREAYVHNVAVPALYIVYGGSVGALWETYSHSSSSDIPARRFFTDGSEIVEGSSTSKGFKDSTDTKFALENLMTALVNAFKHRLRSGQLTCDDLPANTDTAFPLVSLLTLDQLAHHASFLDYSQVLEIPGNIAGGIGSSDHFGPDTRSISGNLVVHRNVDASGRTTSIDLTTDLTIKVEDTVDFCPGNLGDGMEQLLTVSLQIMEANDAAYDVPFTVTFTPHPERQSILASELPADCNPSDDDPQPPSEDPRDAPNNPAPQPPDPNDPNPVPAPEDDSGDVATILSSDPNDIIGPAGFGPENWVRADDTQQYIIRFENEPTASAPAQRVRITIPLDPDLDFRTFRIGGFGFGSTVIEVPENRAFYATRVDLSSTLGIAVDFTSGIDLVAGEAFWEFDTIDPLTGAAPANPNKGFLPPNISSPEGDGFVSFSIRPKAPSISGARIDSQATIVFDINEPIDTPPIFNTLDVAAPTSQVAALPAVVGSAEFPVSWTGDDGADGSSLAGFDIYVSENGGPYVPWLAGTTLTEAVFPGRAGHTYAFYSIARDNAGHVEDAPATADAQTALIWEGSAGDDVFTLRLDVSGEKLEFFLGDPATEPPTFVYPKASLISPVRIHGLAGNDVMLIDATRGNPVPAAGIVFDGGSGTNIVALRGLPAAVDLTISGSELQWTGSTVSYANAIVELGQGSAEPGSIPVVTELKSLSLTGAARVRIAAAARDGTGRRNERILVLGDLVIGPDAQLDVQDNSVILRNISNTAAKSQELMDKVRSGRLGGAGSWEGPGIVSSSARVDELGITTVGVMDNNFEGNAFRTEYHGVPVDASTVILKYTYFGDTDLDGEITGSDYSVTDLSHWLQTENPSWKNGDNNGDGVVDELDYALMDLAYWAQEARKSTGVPTVARVAPGLPKTSAPEWSHLLINAPPVAIQEEVVFLTDDIAVLA